MTWLEQLSRTFAETVFSGSMVAAVPIALLAGFVSFASPCVLPLVPGYLGFVGGMVGADAGGSARGGSKASNGSRARLVLGILGFVAGFTLVFALMTLALTSVGMYLFRWQDVITRVLGVLVLLMGLAFLGAVPFLQRERRFHMSPKAGVWGAPLLGIVFGLGWAPCIGPTLGAVQALAIDGGDLGRAMTLVIAYCLGLGLPFVLVALGLKSSAAMMAFLRRHRLLIMRLGGGLLVLLGLALITGVWSWLANWLQGFIDGFVTVI
ncbi:cytochrome c biogenesis CcdA family protein [Occultella gossypii]|uniref:Cytochrome c biogenesis protein CcdA n=1 Tax=Occultella gossypii TaxID=2800820 RepID=A0ABS7SD03_9MICO|nr:cytochrome c biogenesis CcdA family protein [Occultella gossypii]MBZ2198050.1 cytochrome c biogenesis protein CcdA [Occultella gossypii]